MGGGEVGGCGCGGGVGEEEEAVEGDGEGDEAVDYEEPAPTCEALESVHGFVNAGLDEAANHGAGEA